MSKNKDDACRLLGRHEKLEMNQKHGRQIYIYFIPSLLNELNTAWNDATLQTVLPQHHRRIGHDNKLL